MDVAMGYTAENWKARIAQRNDLTMGLVHLTRDQGKTSGLDILLKILVERKLIGSDTTSGFIVGSNRAVCLQEAPIYSLAQNIYTEQEYRKENKKAKTRYLGFGLQFNKRFVYEKHGRPVIYDKTQAAKSYLPQSEWWRIVNFDLNNEKAIIDWSHEREWRVPGDLTFELTDVSVVLPNGSAYRKFVEKCEEKNELKILSSVNGIVQLGMVFY
jgi:hypothetical protein